MTDQAVSIVEAVMPLVIVGAGLRVFFVALGWVVR